MSQPKSTIKVWLQLFRAPNLFTVPGDPLAGFLLASAGRAPAFGALCFAILASLCFYCYGLLLNDLADLEEDRRDRPSRPLPSGAVKKRVVAQTAWMLALAGIAFSYFAGTQAFWTGCALLVAVALYELVGKKIPIFAQ